MAGAWSPPRCSSARSEGLESEALDAELPLVWVVKSSAAAMVRGRAGKGGRPECLSGGEVPRGGRVSAETSLGAGSDALASWLRGADLLGRCALTGRVPLDGCVSGEQ